MADTQSTPGPVKPAIKPEQYTPPAKTGSPEPEKADQPVTAKAGKATAVKADQAVPRLMAVTITIDADSAEVIRVEGVEANGARHELSDEQKASLMKERRPDERLAAVVAEAFEAGIACVLGDEEEEETQEEAPEDAEFRRRLLAPLIERSALRRLTERAALNRAILGTLIEHSKK